MDKCDSSRALSQDVRDFISHVRSIKEESITDFLVWKWKILDSRFNFIRSRAFTHEEESTFSGADFNLELWLVGSRRHIKLSVQAKKFVKEYGSYVRALRYPGNTKGQMNTLLSYSKTNGHIPAYLIYSIPDSSSAPNCSCTSSCGAIFLADAYEMERIADERKGQRVSREFIISKCIPFIACFAALRGLHG